MHNSWLSVALLISYAQPNYELCIMNYELSKVFPDVAAEVFVGELDLLRFRERLG